MTIRELQKEIHRNATEHGFWDKPQEIGTLIALVHSELSEALEEAREGRLNLQRYHNCDCVTIRSCDGCPGQKPEGMAVELADAVIRIMDMCEHFGFDLGELIAIKHEYNKKRPYMHGKVF